MTIGKLSTFDVKSGLWTSYMDRMDMYFKVNKVEEDLKLPTMIASMGDEAYELLVNLASPRKPSELTYGQANELLRNHLQPTPSSLAERYRYRQKRQGPAEDVATYVAELKKLSRHCKFGSYLNENLRDQFICGLRSDVIRQRLFAEDDSITFVQAVRLASSLEAAERDAAEVEGTSAAPETTSAVHAISRGAGRGGRPRARRGGGAGAATSAGHVPGQHRAANTTVGRKRGNCGACGATNHDYESCRYRDFVCSRCQRTGHLRRVCPEQGSERDTLSTRGAPRRQQEDRSGGFHFSGAGRESSEEDDLEANLNLLALNNYKAV